MMNITLFLSKDIGFLEEKAQAHITTIQKDATQEILLEVVAGNITTSSEADNMTSKLFLALEARNLFAEKKIVWLRHVNWLGGKKVADLASINNTIERLQTFIEQETTTDVIDLIISCDSLDSRTAFAKLLQKKASITKHEVIDRSRDFWLSQATQLVKKRSVSHQLTWQNDALEAFCHLVEPTIQEIEQELLKIALYFPPKEAQKIVTLDIVNQLTSLSQQSIIFEIGRLLTNKQVSACCHLISREIAENNNAIGVMRVTLIPAIRNAFYAGLLQETYAIKKHIKYPEFQQQITNLALDFLPKNKAGKTSFYPIFLSLPTAQRKSTKQWLDLLKKVHAVDKMMVSQNLDHESALHQIVVEFCQ